MTMEEALERVAKEPMPDPNLSDDDIDFSDIPELTEKDFVRMQPLYQNGKMVIPRPPKTRPGKRPVEHVSLTLDHRLFHNLKREAKRKRTTYQTLIHRILTDHLTRAG